MVLVCQVLWQLKPFHYCNIAKTLSLICLDFLLMILPTTTKHDILGILLLGLHDQSNLYNLLHNRMVIQPLEIPLNLSKTLCTVTPSSSSKFRRGISCIDVLRDLLDVFVPGVRVCDEFVGVAIMIGGIRVDPMTRIVVESLLAGDFVSDIESDTLNVTVNGNIFIVTHRRQLLPGSIVNYGNVFFFGNGWDDLVHMLSLTPRIPLVFTKPIRAAENDLRMLQICRWARHDRHFDESDTFYRPLLAHVINKGRLTIPAEFVSKHELYTYDHAILQHRGVEFK
ncbi:hypothetical protein Tco_1331320, partial [Tanacetum coccineum]